MSLAAGEADETTAPLELFERSSGANYCLEEATQKVNLCEVSRCVYKRKAKKKKSKTSD